jgi:hypothetical protein
MQLCETMVAAEHSQGAACPWTQPSHPPQSRREIIVRLTGDADKFRCERRCDSHAKIFNFTRTLNPAWLDVGRWSILVQHLKGAHDEEQ